MTARIVVTSATSTPSAGIGAVATRLCASGKRMAACIPAIIPTSNPTLVTATLALALASALSTGCAGRFVETIPEDAARSATTRTTTFHLIRHAEKASDDPKDPDLNEAGRLRAQRLADRLQREPVDAIYATGYRRTQRTAAPLAAMRGIGVHTYDAAMPVAEFALWLEREHPAGTVLVVGHSNTIPGIASALCGCDVAPIEDREYDRWITVSIARKGAREADRRIEISRY
jgi:broad specificity phosphatase PhoE